MDIANLYDLLRYSQYYWKQWIDTIIPFVYDQASQYYYALYLAHIANENADVEHFKTPVKEFTIETPRAQRRPRKLFKFREDEK